jgi:hypothetical protein
VQGSNVICDHKSAEQHIGADMAPYTITEVSATQSNSWSTAPNGSARCHDFYTIVTSKQVWADTEDNGIYAGRFYRITDRYISNSPARRGQLMDSSSDPWTEQN